MTRAYASAARDERAVETRSRIIEAAAGILLRDGLAAMTIATLARDAGVSPQTIYNSVGGKSQVVKAAYDVMLAGDADPTPMSERAEFWAIQAARDVTAFAAAYAHWSMLIYQRVGALLGALISHGTAGDPVLEEFVATINAERRRGNSNGVAALARRGLLPEAGLDVIIDGVWALTAPENWFRLVHERGWTSQQYERWLSRVLAAVLQPTDSSADSFTDSPADSSVESGPSPASSTP